MSSNERVYKTEAVILRRIDFGETDFLVTLFTPQQGKVKAIAKGARKPTGRLTGQVELYAHVNMVITRGRDLHIITQAESRQSHTFFEENLEGSVYASHFVELLDQFAAEGVENRPAFQLITQALAWLCEPNTNWKLAARYYEFRLLRVMGFEPMLFNCAIGSEILEAENQFFSPVDGGVICEDHAAGREFMRISLPVFKILRHFIRMPWAQVEALTLTSKQAKELERILHTYLIFILERNLKSVGILRQLKRDVP
jgi:DNA repair protein RecO (recombination protein O)